MNVFREDCPYCGTKSVAFRILDEKSFKEVSLGYIAWDTFAQCGYCKRGIVATFEVSDRIEPPSKLNKKRRLLYIAPKRPSSTAPKHTPDNVARFFEQAMDNLPKNWDASGSMFRKALDTGLKSKFPEIKGKLIDRIKKAAAQQKLTPDLAKWAHQIRLDGNDAVHEEYPFSKNDAEKLRDFTHLVFLYLFTLPGMLEESQKKTEE